MVRVRVRVKAESETQMSSPARIATSSEQKIDFNLLAFVVDPHFTELESSEERGREEPYHMQTDDEGLRITIATEGMKKGRRRLAFLRYC